MYRHAEFSHYLIISFVCLLALCVVCFISSFVRTTLPRNHSIFLPTQLTNFNFNFIHRLKTDIAGGAWCPSKQLGPNTSGSEWIQVDLGQSFVITGIATQGRYGKGLGQEFSEAYQVLYSRQSLPAKWIQWKSWDGRLVS